MNRDISGRLDAKANEIPLYSHDTHFDILADDQALIEPARDDKH
jgi:hypothetical protein